MSLDELVPPECGGDLRIALFERYCAGDTSAQEQAEIEAWMAQHPQEQEWYTRVRSGLAAGSFAEMPESDVRHHIDAILSRVREVMPHRHTTPERRMVRPRLWVRDRSGWPMWPAVAALVVVVVAWFGSGIAERHAEHQTPPMLTYTTGNRQQATITLPDGSTAVLNVASRLDVPVDYLAGNHRVRLRGEALFTVTNHERGGTPFTVTTGTAVARVLGTSFLVRCYATDTATVVAVREGKVSVGMPGAMSGRAMVLVAAQQAEIPSSGHARVGVVNPARFSFATGVLTLTGGLLVHAIPDLDRWYDADIRINDPALTTRRLTGEYGAGSLADLTAILEMTFDVRVVRDGRVLTLYPR